MYYYSIAILLTSTDHIELISQEERSSRSCSLVASSVGLNSWFLHVTL